MRSIGLAAMLVLGAATPLRADPPEPKCAFRNDPPWSYVEPFAAASKAPLPTFTLDRPRIVVLPDASQVRFATPLAKPVAPADRGGLFTLHIDSAGTYRFALQFKSWIDVIRDGKMIASVAHAHGEPCSGVAKIVDFLLAPGDYTVQLSGIADATTGLSVTKQP